jgi:hypothetical protein
MTESQVLEQIDAIAQWKSDMPHLKPIAPSLSVVAHFYSGMVNVLAVRLKGL